MNEWWVELVGFASSERLWSLARALILLTVGYALGRLVSSMLVRLLGEKMDRHRAQLLKRGSYYLILILFLLSALRELGFSLDVLLGAAGILTVAIGFASQTSASNLISGLFLVAERPFSVGDIIRVGSTQGEVLSIDLLSVKLRTFDNLFIRIPNESLIKSEVTTLTRYPIRRIDIQVGVAYKENLKQVREVLLDVADRNPLCLEEPKPLYIFQAFADSSMNIQLSVWAKRENFIELKNSIHEGIKNRFDELGIEIPYPHRTLYAGSTTAPFPLRDAGEPRPPGKS